MVAIVEIAILWCAALIAASLLAALAYPFVRRAVAANRPGLRSFAVLTYGLVPAAAATVVLFLISNPEFAESVVPAHCHAESCSPHAPVMTPASLGGAGLVASSTFLVLAVVVTGLYRLRWGRRRLDTLASLSGPKRRAGYRIVESPDLFAWCCGLWSADIIVSRGLVERLSPSELAAVLAHERAHACRRDNLRLLALRWATLFWPPPLRQRIRRDLANDCEAAADADAMRLVRDPQAFISALEIMYRPTAARRAGRGIAACSSEVRERVAAASVDGANRRVSLPVHVIFAGVCLLQVTSVAALTHYAAEWIVTIGM